jgi:iron complex outermembrane recepter protein
MFGGGGPPKVGRWNISLSHTILLSDEVQFFDGGPVFDRLDGAVAGDGGGSRTHEVQLEGGVNFLTAGVRLFGTWRSEAELRGATPAQDLTFEPNLTLNLRAFAQLPPGIVLTDRYPFLGRLRFVLRVDNLTDTAPKVRDRTGATPAAYQPGLLAPRGRLVEFSVRKQF